MARFHKRKCAQVSTVCATMQSPIHNPSSEPCWWPWHSLVRRDTSAYQLISTTTRIAWQWRWYLCSAIAPLIVPLLALHHDEAVAIATPPQSLDIPIELASVAPSPVAPTLEVLVRQCAPTISPNTLLAIMRTESGFNPLALNVNGGVRLRRPPANSREAIGWSTWLVRHGYSVDMGLMQINSYNLARLRITVTEAFDPCRNIQAAATILAEQYYLAAAHLHESSTQAVLAALSAYNTGNFHDGFRNGYVAKVLKNSNPR